MSYLIIIRPVNCIFTAICVFFGATYGLPFLISENIIYAILSAILIAAGGYVINDVFDYEIDLINRPKRILPRGKLSLKKAELYAYLLLGLGLGFSILLRNIYCLIIAIINTIFLISYAKYFKKKLLSGNLIIAFVAASTFLFGGLANGNLHNSLIITVFALLFTLLREFTKDIEDISGDSAKGARTLATVFGKQRASLFSIIPGVSIILLINYLFSQHYLTITYFLLLNLLVSIPVIIFLIRLSATRSEKEIRMISTGMKLDMLILLILIWTGNIYENIR
ncbi:MAG: geranylgeranylglycerol-phosphate geranylgeranyltransferase [Candidatus Cloacimonetes bacterium]|nr:geranylgeranylglycerol-phosphate geranylgeranyltransferase [Candidatus Cloacimonadota bacterium]